MLAGAARLRGLACSGAAARRALCGASVPSAPRCFSTMASRVVKSPEVAPLLRQPLNGPKPLFLRRLCSTAAAEAPPNPIFEWVHFGVALGGFYAANHFMYKGFAMAGIAFPASLVGMFGILGGLWGLSAAGMEPTAAKIVAAARPALNWVTRYLPLFYVPALIVLPLVVGMLDPVDLGKIGVVTAAGFPFSLFAAGGVVLAIRKMAQTELLPVAKTAGMAPFGMFHVAGILAVVAASCVASTMFEKGTDEAWMAQQMLLLSTTVGGLVFGSIPPAAIAGFMPHPVVTTTIAAHLGVALSGQLSGSGYWDTLKSYLTKGKGGEYKGAGDLLMSFLGVVVLTFGFHIYGQRALLTRHAAEIVGCAAVASILSMAATAAAGRLIQLPPDLSLALVPRSVTVALAMPIATQLTVPEELIPVCAGAVLVTGLVGAMFTQRLMTAFGFADPLTRGLATASSCHGFGAATLAATEPAALPFAALGYGLAGIASSCWAAVPPVQNALIALAGKEPKAA